MEREALKRPVGGSSPSPCPWRMRRDLLGRHWGKQTEKMTVNLNAARESRQMTKHSTRKIYWVYLAVIKFFSLYYTFGGVEFYLPQIHIEVLTPSTALSQSCYNMTDIGILKVHGFQESHLSQQEGTVEGLGYREQAHMATASQPSQIREPSQSQKGWKLQGSPTVRNAGKIRVHNLQQQKETIEEP